MKDRDSCILIHIYLCLVGLYVEYMLPIWILTRRTSRKHINYIFGLMKCVLTEISLIHLVTLFRLFAIQFTASKNYMQN